MAVVIKNQLNQRLVIILIGGKTLDILAKGSARISEDELSSEHLQILIAKGDIAVMQMNSASKGKSKVVWKSGKEAVKKKKLK